MPGAVKCTMSHDHGNRMDIRYTEQECCMCLLCIWRDQYDTESGNPGGNGVNWTATYYTQFRSKLQFTKSCCLSPIRPRISIVPSKHSGSNVYKGQTYHNIFWDVQLYLSKRDVFYLNADHMKWGLTVDCRIVKTLTFAFRVIFRSVKVFS